MSALLTFPGQGAQRPGMLHSLLDHRAVHETLAQTSDALGHDVMALDTADSLQSTVSVQLCLLAAGVATARALMADGARPEAVAGLSIGAYAAAVVAGALAYDDAVRLVALRGRLMADAYPQGFGMTAILGLEAPALEAIVTRVRATGLPVYVANFNAPTQLVIAGADVAMARVAALAQEAGAHGAKRVAIAVPSHCPLLDDAAASLAQAFAPVTLRRPTLRLFSASAARELRDPARIAARSAANMALPVRWHETMLLARACGVRLAVEMPPGNVLTRLAGMVLPEAVACAETRADSVRVLMDRASRGE